MATISIGFVKGLVFPVNGMSQSQAIEAMTNSMRWALSRGPYCYAKNANITFVGSSRPHITIGNCRNPGAWAEAYIRGWGVGQVLWSIHPTVIALWNKKWPTKQQTEQTLNSLWGHECGHPLLNTRDQSVGLPLSASWKKRLMDHYGPVQMRAARVLDELDSVPEADRRGWWWRLFATKVVTKIDEIYGPH